MTEKLTYSCIAFKDLRLDTLYQLMQLRQSVFVVEQNCPYLDADGKDQSGYHIMIHHNDILLAYARLLPKGVGYKDYCAIGRVVTAQDQRGKKLGKKLMKYAIDQAKYLYPSDDIKISAQCYLLDFYKGFQFKEVGEEYLEDDIPHKAMIRKRS